ncbi:MAG: hypothetical protein HC833_20760 [Leptolyngbyaceae cyanobacterium RM1_406_9]|nr:hypothetical protein [Leptolyngbyaceae cyanobacterium RM1_406_9]
MRICTLKQLWLHPLGHGSLLALVSLLAGCESVSVGGEQSPSLPLPHRRRRLSHMA